MFTDWFNSLMYWIVEIALLPFAAMKTSLSISMFVFSFAFGILMLYLFGFFSNQEKVERIKSKIKGRLLEMWIFRANLKVVLRAQFQTFFNTFKYLWITLPAILLLLVVVLPVLAQLQARFGYEPLHVAEPVVMKVKYNEQIDLDDMDFELELPEGLSQDTEILRMPFDNEADVRLRCEQPGSYMVTIRAKDQVVTKSFEIDTNYTSQSPIRTTSLVDRILFPVENTPSDGVIKSVEIAYPDRELDYFGWKMHWLWPFCIVSLASALLFKNVLGIEI